MNLLQSDLRPGDVLMSYWANDLAKAVRVFDGGSYSHASIWTGERLIEAALPSVRERTLEECFEHGPEYLDAFRHASLGDKGADVVREARRFLGRSYALGDLALTILVAAGSNALIDRPEHVRFLKSVGDLNRLFGLAKEEKNELVTCSELVARAFVDAGLTLHVPTGGAGKNEVDTLFQGLVVLGSAVFRGVEPTDEEVVDVEGWRRDLVTKAEELFDAPMVTRRVTTQEPYVLVGEKGWGPNLVSLRHLERSPEMQRLGRLYPR